MIALDDASLHCLEEGAFFARKPYFGARGNLAVVDELYSPDFVCHFAFGPKWRRLEGIKSEVASHRDFLPRLVERVCIYGTGR